MRGGGGSVDHRDTDIQSMTTGATERSRSRRRQSLTVTLSLWTLTLVNLLRVGVQDHNWVVAAAIAVCLVGAVPVMERVLARRDAQALAESPAGTVFFGGGNALA